MMNNLLKINGITIRKDTQTLSLTSVELNQLMSILGRYVSRGPLMAADRPIVVPDFSKRPRFKEAIQGNQHTITDSLSLEFNQEPITKEAFDNLRKVKKEKK